MNREGYLVDHLLFKVLLPQLVEEAAGRSNPEAEGKTFYEASACERQKQLADWEI